MADRHSEDRVGKLVVVDTVRSADADKCGGTTTTGGTLYNRACIKLQ